MRNQRPENIDLLENRCLSLIEKQTVHLKLLDTKLNLLDAVLAGLNENHEAVNYTEFCTNKKSKNKKVSLSKSIKDTFLNLASATTAHGIPNILKTQNLTIQIMWAAFILVYASVCSWLV
jgi:hypothetical protein